MKKIILSLVCGVFWIAGASFVVAATIPAGTQLVARTLEPISSHERVGAVVKAELEQDVAISGKVLLRAGTQVTGVVETSLRRPTSSSGLTVNLTAVSVNGRKRPGSYNRRLQAREVQDEDRRFRLRSRVQLSLSNADGLSARAAAQVVVRPLSFRSTQGDTRASHTVLLLQVRLCARPPEAALR